MKTTLSLGMALLTFLGITKAAPPDNNAPQVLIEAKFIEVGEEAKDLLAPFAATGKSPSVSVMLNDEQLSTLWKKIESTKGVDVLSMPRVTTRSGQEAKIEVGRKFAYKDASGKPATKQLGTVLTLLPKITGEHEIALDVSPQIVELEGMVKLESGVERPVFKERKATASVAMMSGQTVALGLPSASTKQTTEDRSAGHVTAKTEDVIRHAVVFVTARLIDPATGKPVDPKPAAEKSTLQVKLDSIILPSVVFADATFTEAVEFLRHKSLDLDTTTTDPNQKGVNMILKAGAKTPEARMTLNLKNIPLGQALKYVAQLSDRQLVIESHGVLLLTQADFEAQQKRAAGLIAKEASPAEVHANKIILPQVQFHEATLDEAITFIRIKSLQLDPEKKGVNILVKPGGDPKARITMQLKDVPAYEALRYCAEIAGHALSVDGDVFVITPKDPSPTK
jgi:hypothetical protein